MKRNVKINPTELANFLAACDTNTKVYFGCDSERFKLNGQWYAEYIVVAVVHINGSRGCRIFGEIFREKDYDQKAKRPMLRLMNEVYKVADLYLRMYDVVSDYEVEIHLDINPNEMHASSLVVDQATGYIKGMCNVVPLVKPNAFAASYAADRLKSITNL
jgi:predicted RNase H-related nuclease YkuK (DUF458 family)